MSRNTLSPYFRNMTAWLAGDDDGVMPGTETAPDRVGDKASNLAALRLRYQLTPYLYSLAHQAHQNGDAIFPPLMMYYQDDQTARSVDKTKMIGPWLLFTALTDSAATVNTYLPRGNWVDFLNPSRVINSAGAVSNQPVLIDT